MHLYRIYILLALVYCGKMSKKAFSTDYRRRQKQLTEIFGGKYSVTEFSAPTDPFEMVFSLITQF